MIPFSGTYEPHQGYGPLRFGMSGEDVLPILGKPESIFKDADEVFDWDIFDEEDKAFIEDHETWIYEDKVRDHDFFSVRFAHGKLVEISIFAKSLDVQYAGLNLMAADRKELMRTMAKAEAKLFANNASYFFPKAGIAMTDPRFWKEKGTVEFVVSDYIMERLDFQDWEELDALDF